MFTHVLSIDQIDQLKQRARGEITIPFHHIDVVQAETWLKLSDFLQISLADAITREREPASDLYLFCSGTQKEAYLAFCLNEVKQRYTTAYYQEIFLRLSAPEKKTFFKNIQQILKLDSYIVTLCENFELIDPEDKPEYAAKLYGYLSSDSDSEETRKISYIILYLYKAVPAFFNYLAEDEKNELVSRFIYCSTELNPYGYSGYDRREITVAFANLGSIYPNASSNNQSEILRSFEKSLNYDRGGKQLESKRIAEHALEALDKIILYLDKEQLIVATNFVVNLLIALNKEGFGFQGPRAEILFPALAVLFNVVTLIKQRYDYKVIERSIEALNQSVNQIKCYTTNPLAIESQKRTVLSAYHYVTWAFFSDTEKQASLQYVTDHLDQALYLNIARDYFKNASLKERGNIKSSLLNALTGSRLELKQIPFVSALIEIHPHNAIEGQNEILGALVKNGLCFNNHAFNKIFFDLRHEEQDKVSVAFLKKYAEFLKEGVNPSSVHMININRELYNAIDFKLRVEFIQTLILASRSPNRSMQFEFNLTRSTIHLLAAMNDEIKMHQALLQVLMLELSEYFVPELYANIRNYLIPESMQGFLPIFNAVQPASVATTHQQLTTSTASAITAGDKKDHSTTQLLSTTMFSPFFFRSDINAIDSKAEPSIVKRRFSG